MKNIKMKNVKKTRNPDFRKKTSKNVK